MDKIAEGNLCFIGSLYFFNPALVKASLSSIKEALSEALNADDARPRFDADGEPRPVHVRRGHQSSFRGEERSTFRPRLGGDQHSKRPRSRPQALQRVPRGLQPEAGGNV